MSKLKKITAALITATVCLGSAALAGAAGTDELSITASSSGGYELQINLQNTSEYYLGNIDISVEGETSSGVKVQSFGFSGTNTDTKRVIAPGESVSVYAKIDPASVPAETTKNNPEQPAPSQTVPPQTNGGQSNPSSEGPSQTNPPASNDQSVNNGGDGNTGNEYDGNYPSAEETTAGEENVGGETESEPSGTATDGSTEAENSSLHIIHSMAPGESVTLYTTLAGGTDDEPVKVMPAEEIPSYTIWIVLGVVAVLGAAAFVVIRVKKKKSSGKDIASVIVIALLLTALVSGDVCTVYAQTTELKEPISGHVEKTVSIASGNANVVIKADYTVVPAAVTQPLKSARKANSDDESNIPQVNEKRLTANSGPLTSHGIYIGENDFMFYGVAIDDYTGKSIMDNTRMKKLSDMMNSRDSWAKENGIKLYLVIAPNKSTVYSEYVPDKLTAAEKTNADLAVEYLAQNSTVEVVDLRQPLINAKSEYGDTLFYKYDTHWNNNGGFVGYTEIMRRVNEDVSGAYTLSKSDFNISDHETYMKDMAYYLGYYSKYTDYGPVYTLKNGMTATIGEKQHDGYWGQFRFCARWKDGYSDALKLITYENTYNEGAPSLYVYRDSFAVSLVHFLKDSFHNSVFDWSYDFNKEEVLNSGADVVIMEVVEKQLYEFTNSRTFS